MVVPQNPQSGNAVDLSTIWAKIITLHILIVSNYVPRLCNNSLHYRIGFEIFPRLCTFLRCYKAFHVHIHRITLHKCVFTIFRLCN